jgi:hypothetical protein
MHPIYTRVNEIVQNICMHMVTLETFTHSLLFRKNGLPLSPLQTLNKHLYGRGTLDRQVLVLKRVGIMRTACQFLNNSTIIYKIKAFNIRRRMKVYVYVYR